MNLTLHTANDCCPITARAIGEEASASLAATLKALADPVRLRMLSAIALDPRGECCVCDLEKLAQVSQPTISHHLKKLKDTGLLTSDRRGTWVYYRITEGHHGAVMALLNAFVPVANGPDRETNLPLSLSPETMDDRVTRLAKELAESYAGLSPELVLGVVRESAASLIRTATVTQHIVPLAERFARQRLADLSRDKTASAPQVLFVCVANAGRSQLAAAVLNDLSGGRVVARSAGSSPASEIHPHVRSVLEEMGPEAAEESFPKPLTDDAVRAADVVITMGCGDVCPVLPGVRYEDWAVGDPALASREGVEAIRDEIAARVRLLVEDLLS